MAGEPVMASIDGLVEEARRTISQASETVGATTAEMALEEAEPYYARALLDLAASVSALAETQARIEALGLTKDQMNKGAYR
jgi:hypothetical protein